MLCHKLNNAGWVNTIALSPMKVKLAGFYSRPEKRKDKTVLNDQLTNNEIINDPRVVCSDASVALPNGTVVLMRGSISWCNTVPNPTIYTLQ